MDFLGEIIARKRIRVSEAQRITSLETIRNRALKTIGQRAAHRFRNALFDNSRVNIIAEFKRRSPSKGVIRDHADPCDIARLYHAGGAAAISVLTEEDYFDGSLNDLETVRACVDLPVLRKDFVFDRYQVYEAAASGADAVLLIVTALDDGALRALRELAEEELSLDALVEVHSAPEMERAVSCGASLIGVNNRNLSTFEVTLETSLELARQTSPDKILISESGLGSWEDLKRLRAAGYRGFLIGESLMRSAEPDRTLRDFLEAAQT